MSKPVPTPSSKVALAALQAMLRQQSALAALEIFHGQVGNVFRANLPGFRPVMLAGAEAARWVLVEARDQLLWRAEQDPITRLLRHGLLVADGPTHDDMRKLVNPALHRNAVTGYVAEMWQAVDTVAATWGANSPVEMLTASRQMAMQIIMRTLFSTDFSAHIGQNGSALWRALLHTLQYISPGVWVLNRHIPRPQYRRALARIETYLRQIIARRRAQPVGDNPDLLGLLILAGATNEQLRDQILTMIIAGHDTSTSLLAWAMYLLGGHPAVLAQAQAEVDLVLGTAPPSMEKLAELPYLGHIIDETMRLYPPAHLGSRIAASDLVFDGFAINKGERVTYSIYVTQRMAQYWPNPAQFDPDRFSPAQSKNRVPYSFIPFGGGPRNCVGALFAQTEAKVILARLLQRYHLHLPPQKVRAHMAVTIEPRPGVWLQMTRR
jgi:cytochrome P450